MFGVGNFTGSTNGILNSFFSRSTSVITSSLGCPPLRTLGLSFSVLKKIFSNNEDEILTEMKDMSLQTSTYNKVIPDVFGRVRIAGNIIWASDIQYTDIHHQAKTTKYGTDSAYTETLIRGSFAIAICKGKVDDIKNIYADNEPLNLSVYNISIYLGDGTQQADPVMQSYLGKDIPAFRDLCYVVFHEFPMEEFSGRIPNFTFEVVRQQAIIEDLDMESLVKSMTIIPATGEFVYDTETQKKLHGGYIMGNFYETEKATILNNHTASKNTDAVDSLNDLCNTFKNLEYVSLVVSWFCNSLDCSIAEVYPACEYNNLPTYPDEWVVENYDRKNARVIGTDTDGLVRYGGTPSDNSVVRYVKEIKKRGLKVCLYPMLMVDADEKPWRGHIKGDADKIHSFFTKENGYNRFVKHYVNLLKDDIDAVIIASEMKGLTGIMDSQGKYPAVDEICNLAKDVRKIVHNNTIITYAADWSEYHHDERGNFNLDKVWSCDCIDVIGIDAYFPLTDETKTTYDVDKIKQGWISGEGYDFFYTDDSRTIKGALEPQWAWKNLEYFWSNFHYNKDGSKTSWVPKSKKIWFTEYGFPSVDCCTNQPNVFYSQGSLDSGFPRMSKGVADFKAQRVAITATEEMWKGSAFVERLFLYTWDARPYPCFPNLKEVWCDHSVWKYGHFLNGKAGQTSLANVISCLCRSVGLKDEDFDTALLKNEVFQGYVIDNKTSILGHIKILANAFNFDCYLDDGKICFKSLDNSQNHILSEEDILVDEDNRLSFLVETITGDAIPSVVELLFLDVNKDYTTTTAMAQNNALKNGDSMNAKRPYAMSVPMPLNLSQAQEMAWKILSNATTQTTYYEIKLPIKFLNIAPLDTVFITINNVNHLIRVKSVEIIDLTTIKIAGVSTIANDNILSSIDYSKSYADDIVFSNNEPEISGSIAKTDIMLFEPYNISNDIDNKSFDVYCAIWSNDKNWKGASIYYSLDSENTYQFLKFVNEESCVGFLSDIFFNRFEVNDETITDTETSFEIVMQNENGKLQSTTDDGFWKLQNLILIGDEIIAFRDVEQLNSNTFKISNLLRGRYNTEINLHHEVGERVVLLDDAIVKMTIPITKKGQTLFVKAIGRDDALANNDPCVLQLSAKSLMFFETKNIDKTNMQNGDIRISFSVRKNYSINNNRLFNEDVVMSHRSSIEIYNATTNEVIRSFVVENKNNVLYEKDMQILDFGKVINASKINVSVKHYIFV